MTHIYATVYTLTEGVEIPSNKSMYTGSASDYHKYGKKVELKLTDELKSVATKNKTVIITKENIESLVIDSNTLPTNTGTTTEGYYVWYVAKFETSDGFHIDGAVDSANYEVSLTSFEDNKKINNQEGYWFEMYVKDLNDANKVIDSSKIKDVNVYAYDENDNEIVHVFATDTLKESLAGKDFMPNKALSGFANIADQDEYWNHEFTDIEGYVTAKKALVKMTLITGKEIESIIDINVTRFVKFDTTAPVITLDSDVKTTVELGSVFTVPSAKAKDAYDGNVTVESSCNVNADKVGTYNLTYTATDKAGNVATLSFEVKVVDTTSPVITLKGDAKVELNRHLYKENLYTDAGFIVTELDGYTTTKTITFTKPYEETSKVVDKVNTTEVGTYVITYTATDKSNNVGTSQRTIIIDQILNSEADMIVTPYINGEEYDFFTKSYSIEVNSAMPTFTADVKDGFNNKIFNWTDEDTSKYLTISSNVNTSVVGSYTVTYVASDWAGNKKTITRTVNVVDTTSPVITLSNSMEKVSYKGVSFEIPEVVVTDNYDKNLTANTEYSIDKTKYVSSKEEIRGKYFGVIIGYKWNYNEKNEIVSVTYTAKDSNGNEAEPVTYVFPERILISDNYVYTIVI